MKGKQIRQITDGSIIVAIYGIIFLLSRFTGGQLEYSFSFLMPLPIAIYGYKYNFKKAMVPFVASVILSVFLSPNPFNSILIIMPLVFSGVLLGSVLIKKNIKPIYAIIIMGLLSSVVEVLSTIAFSHILGMENIFSDISNMIKEIESIIGINSGDFVVIQALMEGLIPSIILIISLMSALTTYLIFVILIKRIFKEELNKKILQFFSVDNMIPKFFTFIYCLVAITSIFSLLYFRYSEGILRVLFIVIINFTLIVGAVYLYFGLRVVALYIKMKKMNALIVLEFMLIIIFPIFFVIIGILDNFMGLQLKIYNKFIDSKQN